MDDIISYIQTKLTLKNGYTNVNVQIRNKKTSKDTKITIRILFKH